MRRNLPQNARILLSLRLLSSRLHQPAVLHRERYDDAALETEVQAYDKRRTAREPIAAVIGVSATQYGAAAITLIASALALIPREIRQARSVTVPDTVPVDLEDPADLVAAVGELLLHLLVLGAGGRHERGQLVTPEPGVGHHRLPQDAGLSDEGGIAAVGPICLRGLREVGGDPVLLTQEGGLLGGRGGGAGLGVVAVLWCGVAVFGGAALSNLHEPPLGGQGT